MPTGYVYIPDKSQPVTPFLVRSMNKGIESRIFSRLFIERKPTTSHTLPTRATLLPAQQRKDPTATQPGKRVVCYILFFNKSSERARLPATLLFPQFFLSKKKKKCFGKIKQNKNILPSHRFPHLVGAGKIAECICKRRLDVDGRTAQQGSGDTTTAEAVAHRREGRGGGRSQVGVGRGDR